MGKKSEWTMAFPSPTYRVAAADGEWELVQALLRPVTSPVAQEFLVHYYISAKTWPLVLLLGRPGMGQPRLFELLTRGIAGCSEGQVRLLPAQARWAADGLQSPAGRPALGFIQGRFNDLAYFDMLGEATMAQNEGRAYFLGLEQATPDELAEYMERYLTNHHRAEPAPPLPLNLYLTAIIFVAGGAWCLPDYLLDRVGIVEVSMPLGQEELALSPHCPPVGWQRLFLRSAVRAPERAWQRLQRCQVLDEFQRLLAALPAELLPLDAALEEGLLLYAANAFTREGAGLLDRTPLTNLRQAIDLQLAQRLLPCIAQRTPWSPERGREIMARLDTIFPRARARVQRILLERSAAEGAAGTARAE